MIHHKIVDNFYSEAELSLIWEELNFLCYPEKMEFAPGGDDQYDTGCNKLIKRNSGLFLDDLYQSYRNCSNILRVNRKIYKDGFGLGKEFFKYLPQENKKCILRDYTLVNYYENSDYYLEHHDDAILTILYWIYKEPKRFEGGDLYLQDEKIELKNNRLIIFPSYIKHSVTEVNMDEEYADKKLGRFCISQFIDVK
jgi:Rps23 Pro-64 3,4-dihydroxylase Tpa1-like proline 4-hydroxylase